MDVFDELRKQLGELEHERNHFDIFMYVGPEQETTTPFVWPLTYRCLTRQEWGRAVELVEAWYASVTDEEIDERNRQWFEREQRRAPPEEKDNGNYRTDGWIYLLKGDRYYKIGQSVNVSNRVEQIEPKMPFPIEIVHTFKVDDMNAAEKDLHERFANKRTGGEWFLLDKDDVEWLKSL